MGLPSKLKNFRLYNDGENYQGVIAEFTLSEAKGRWSPQDKV